jgi:hypothetical protein
MTFDVAAVTAAYEREMAENRPLNSAEDIPLSYEAISDHWLTAVLCGGVPEAQIVGHDLDEPDDGSSNRRRIFIRYNAAGQAAGLPGTVFCKGSQALGNRLLLGIARANEGEVNFYNVVRGLLNINAPVSYFAKFNPDSQNSIVILNDLGSDTLFCTHDTPMTKERAMGQMQLLAKLHGRFLEAPELDSTLQVFDTWGTLFGRLNTPVWAETCSRGFRLAEDVIPARLFARENEIWPKTLLSVELDAARPWTLNHGDTHLRNWSVGPDGEMGLNDWQALCRGHWSRDVIYAIATSLTVADRRAWQEDLLRFYNDELQRISGRSLPFADLLLQVRQQLLTVLTYWTCVIDPPAGVPGMQPRASTLEFLRRIAHAIDDFDVLDSFG